MLVSAGVGTTGFYGDGRDSVLVLAGVGTTVLVGRQGEDGTREFFDFNGQNRESWQVSSYCP